MSIDWAWIERNLSMIGSLLVEHVILSLVPVVIAFVISLPLGYLVSKTRRVANLLLAFFGVIYSVPSLALFVLMPLMLGAPILNPVNIIVALAIYSIALLVRSVVDGLRSVPAPVTQSASAVGYGWLRRLFRVEMPLAMPVIFAGLRSSRCSISLSSALRYSSAAERLASSSTSASAKTSTPRSSSGWC